MQVQMQNMRKASFACALSNLSIYRYVGYLMIETPKRHPSGPMVVRRRRVNGHSPGPFRRRTRRHGAYRVRSFFALRHSALNKKHS